MSDPSLAAWPTAPNPGIDPIQHPAWEEARNAIFELASAGPVTVALIGDAGTGKTWLLRELASAFGDHGFPTMMLMEGDLPMSLSPGAALLVDEAARMGDAMRARLVAQRHGIAILASKEWPADAPKPVFIGLRHLQPDETEGFAAAWLHRAGLPQWIDAGALAQLAARSGGRVATIVQMLRAAVAAPRPPPVAISPAIPPEPPPVQAEPQTAPAIPTRPRRAGIPLTVAALASVIVLGWALRPLPPDTPPAAIAVLPAPANAAGRAAPPGANRRSGSLRQSHRHPTAPTRRRRAPSGARHRVPPGRDHDADPATRPPAGAGRRRRASRNRRPGPLDGPRCGLSPERTRVAQSGARPAARSGRPAPKVRLRAPSARAPGRSRGRPRSRFDCA